MVKTVCYRRTFNLYDLSMKTNELITRFKREKYSIDGETTYEAYGNQTMLSCYISEDFGESIVKQNKLFKGGDLT